MAKKIGRMFIYILVGAAVAVAGGWLLSFAGWIREDWVDWLEWGLRGGWWLLWLWCDLPSGYGASSGSERNGAAFASKRDKALWMAGTCFMLFSFAVQLGAAFARCGN